MTRILLDPAPNGTFQEEKPHVSTDLFLLFKADRMPARASEWLGLYVKNYFQSVRNSKGVAPGQLRITGYYNRRPYTSHHWDQLPHPDRKNGSASTLTRNETIQLRLHGLPAYLLFARQFPAIIMVDGAGLSELCRDVENQGTLQDLKDDAFLVFVTDTRGMKTAQRYGLHAVPWRDQSQEPVLERMLLFEKTRNIKGFSHGVHEVRRKIISYGQKPENRITHPPVLIMGQSRTGKELVAEALYSVSELQPEKFTAVACGTFTQSLLLSEIFGYWPGAFTSSDGHGGVGLMESASGGALLVDDIDAAEDPTGLQGAFLRCLITDPPVYRRVGARPARKPISETAATWLLFTLNKPTGEMIRSGKLREDFLFRFQRIIQTPPFSARLSDIPQIAMEIGKTGGLLSRPLTIPALKYLRTLKSEWRANAGELQALLLLANELLNEDKLLTWTQAMTQVVDRGKDYLAWYENPASKPSHGEGALEETCRSAPNMPNREQDGAGHLPRLPEAPRDQVRVLGETLSHDPDTRYETDVVKRVYSVENGRETMEKEFLETQKRFSGYRFWYALGNQHVDDTQNAADLLRLLKTVFAGKDITGMEASMGEKNLSGKIHCLKVLLFLALQTEHRMRRKDMSLILWDRKGNKPLTSFETHRKILARLMGAHESMRPLNKRKTYENDWLILSCLQNEWLIRLK